MIQDIDMESATQVIIFIVALAFSAGFLAIVIVLVPAIRELTALLADLQKTSGEVRELVEQAKNISSNVEGKLEGIDSIVSNTKTIATGVNRALKAANFNIAGKPELLALIPALLLGYKAISRLKRRNNERQ